MDFRRTGTSCWSGLGEAVECTGEYGISVKEALERSKANYQVAMQPVVALTPELVEAMSNDSMINAGELLSHVIKGAKANMRMDNHDTIGLVSESYGLIQNETMFSYLGMLASGKDMGRDELPIVETAGVIGGGQRCFVTMRMPLPIRINTQKDDIVNMYLIAQNSFDGSGNMMVAISPVRQWCSNQISMIFKTAPYRLSFRHTRFVNERMDLLNKETADMAYRTLGMYDVYKSHFEAELEHLRNIKLAEKDCERILAEVLLPEESFDIYKLNDYNINADEISTRSKNLFHSALDALHTGVGQLDNKELEGSGLWLLNGLTTLYQNSINWKDKEKKFLSITEGNAFNKVQKLHSLILETA
jgi:hypothetical protein